MEVFIRPMQIIVTYRVDNDLYHASNTPHDQSLVTTEYRYGNESLVHLVIGKNLGIRLNNHLGDLLEGVSIQNEQFLFNKTYMQCKPKLITRDTFNRKLKRFDMSQTVIEREILEDYNYIDKRSQPSHVQIVMIHKGDTVTATIDFDGSEQYENFTNPDWLVKLDNDCQ